MLCWPSVKESLAKAKAATARGQLGFGLTVFLLLKHEVTRAVNLLGIAHRIKPYTGNICKNAFHPCICKAAFSHAHPQAIFLNLFYVSDMITDARGAECSCP